MSRFPESSWFATAKAAIDDRLPRRVGLDAHVQFEGRNGTDSVRWVQEFEDGLLSRFELGELGVSDVTISWPLAEAVPIMRGDVTGTKAVWATTITEVRAGGTYVGPFPPMDLDIGLPEVQALPLVPGATVMLQVSCTSSLLGTVSAAMKFLDGQLVAVMPEATDPDVRVEMPFRSMLRLRRGEITILDCLDGGQIWGEQGAIITVAGILESAAYQPVESACAGPSYALATLGDVAPDVGAALHVL